MAGNGGNGDKRMISDDVGGNKGSDAIAMETDINNDFSGMSSFVDVDVNPTDKDMLVGDEGGDVDQDPDDSDDDSENDNDDDDEEDTAAGFVEPSRSKTAIGRRAVADSVFGDFSFAGEETGNVDTSKCEKSLSEDSEKWVGRDLCNTARVHAQKQFVCVKFPGVIKNQDKALACVGGVQEVLEAQKYGKIDFRFRPDDPYCKPVVGLYKKNNHLLVRCLRRRRKATEDSQPSTSTASCGGEESNDESYDESHDDGYEYKVEIIGTVCGIFSFERPCDYQYLPVIKKKDGHGYQEILSDISIKFEDERHHYINRDVPLFLPPYVFSRTEKPAKYTFQSDEVDKEKKIGMARDVRKKGTQRITFNAKETPHGPNKDALALHRMHNMNLEPLHELFRERPLWSKVGIMSRLRQNDQLYLKAHINMVAYYCGSGPWIHLWCRFGFDPRKEPSAKIYQTIDFRIRKAWNREKVVAKRGMDHFLGGGRQGFNTIQGHRLPLSGPGADSKDEGGGNVPSTSTAQDMDIHYQFLPTRMPPHRQVYYQVCDVFDDKIQEMLHQNDGQETECTEKDGWGIPDFLGMSRDILSQHAENLLKMNEDTTASTTTATTGADTVTTAGTVTTGAATAMEEGEAQEEDMT